MKEYAEILINNQVIYTYSVPEELAPEIQIGQEVEIHLRKKNTSGYILRFVNKPDFETKPITAIINKNPYFDEKLVQLAEYIAQKYKCLFPTALKGILPK